MVEGPLVTVSCSRCSKLARTSDLSGRDLSFPSRSLLSSFTYYGYYKLLLHLASLRRNVPSKSFENEFNTPSAIVDRVLAFSMV
jgi:hypothetical protein